MRWLAVALLCALPAQAQEVPRLYDVTGIAEGGVLNLRSAPSPTAPVVAELPRDSTGIEVTDRTATRRWGRVNTAEGVAWVFLRDLTAQDRPLDSQNLPVGLRCFGTEPFWALDNTGDGLRYTDLNGQDILYLVQSAPDIGMPDDLRRLIQMTSQDSKAQAFIYPAQCSDGMSDRLYALSVGLFRSGGEQLQTGCCTLAR
jgi:uncharacterized membrane protein